MTSKLEQLTECCDECNKTLAYCDCEPIGHQTIDTFKALDESLDKLLEDDFVEDAVNYMLGEFTDEEKLRDVLQRHEAHVREKAVEDIKKDYRENATNEEKMSFASGQTLARVISLITKKDV